jgi:hypothetical protein
VNTQPSSAAAGTAPAVVSTAMAMARSKPVPWRGRLAGCKVTVIARAGHGWPLLRTAA